MDVDFDGAEALLAQAGGTLPEMQEIRSMQEFRYFGHICIYL